MIVSKSCIPFHFLSEHQYIVFHSIFAHHLTAPGVTFCRNIRSVLYNYSISVALKLEREKSSNFHLILPVKIYSLCWNSTVTADLQA